MHTYPAFFLTKKKFRLTRWSLIDADSVMMLLERGLFVPLDESQRQRKPLDPRRETGRYNRCVEGRKHLRRCRRGSLGIIGVDFLKRRKK